MTRRSSGKAARRLRRWLISLALTAAFLAAAAGIALNLAIPLYWQEHNQQYVTIISGSMVPTIDIGDQILITNRTDETVIKVGDVVTFHSSDPASPALVSHRVIEISHLPDHPGTWLRTQGDANPTPDPNLTNETSVVGVMDRNLGLLGSLMVDAQTREWRLLYFGPALFMMAMLELPGVWRRAPQPLTQSANDLAEAESGPHEARMVTQGA